MHTRTSILIHLGHHATLTNGLNVSTERNQVRPSTLRVRRFLRLRITRSGVHIRRNLCIREGVRIRTRCECTLPLAQTHRYPRIRNTHTTSLSQMRSTEKTRNAARRGAVLRSALLLSFSLRCPDGAWRPDPRLPVRVSCTLGRSLRPTILADACFRRPGPYFSGRCPRRRGPVDGGPVDDEIRYSDRSPD